LEAERKLLQRAADMDPAIAAELAALEEDLAALKGKTADMVAALEVASAASERTARLQDEIDRLAAGECWVGGQASIEMCDMYVFNVHADSVSCFWFTPLPLSIH
jgi:hypothetical protein